jgi:hypothetical protein
VTYAKHVQEAERLVNKSVDGDAPHYYSDAEDAALRLAWATQAQVHATLALVASQPVQRALPPKVWVATIYEYDRNMRPAVYVSDSEDDLTIIVRKQQGISPGADLHTWLTTNRKVLNMDSYYVETADD